jgi:hypothetical protein
MLGGRTIEEGSLMYLLYGISMAGTMFGLVVITSWPTPAEYRMIIAGVFWVIATVALVGGTVVAHFDPSHPFNREGERIRRTAHEIARLRPSQKTLPG